MGIDRPLTRRRLLAFSGVAAASLAGCSSDPPQAPTRSVFVGRRFEEGNLRIDLREGHSVDRLNLIGPDGRRFSYTDVATGETTVALRLLDIKPRGAGFDHYTSGSHDLIAISGEEELERTTIELRPELRIVDVHQYREGDDANDFGKLVVEVENVGTGPTWVYDVTYEGAPNFAANSNLGSDPGILRLDKPGNPIDAILQPGTTRSFVDLTLPLVFHEENSQNCEEKHEFKVIVGTATSQPLEAEIGVEAGGQMVPANLTGAYTCTDNTVKY